MTEWKPEAGEDAVVRVLGLLTTTDGQYHAQIERSRATIPVSALRPIPTALSAEDALNAERETIATEARRYASHYTLSTDPHNTFILFAEYVERRRSTPPAAVAAFKVGDRVRVKDDPKWLQHGKSGTVRRTTDAGRENWVAYVAIDGLDAPPVCYDFSGLEPDADPATPRDTTAQASTAELTESPADMLHRLGDDAAKWAAEFCKTAARLGHLGIDEGWMIGWFANAIEHSHAVRRWAAEKNAPRPDTTALRDAVVDAAKAEYRALRDPDIDAQGYDGSNARERADNLRMARIDAVYALLAAEAPADPVVELRKAADEAEVLLTEIAAGAAIDDDRKLQRKLESAATRLRAALSALGDRGRG